MLTGLQKAHWDWEPKGRWDMLCGAGAVAGQGSQRAQRSAQVFNAAHEVLRPSNAAAARG